MYVPQLACTEQNSDKNNEKKISVKNYIREFKSHAKDQFFEMINYFCRTL